MSAGKRWRACKRAIEFAVFRAVEAAMGILPFRLRVSVATCAIRLAARLRINRLSRENIDRAYGDSLSPREKKRILRGLHRTLGRILAEIVQYRKEGLAYVERMIEMTPEVRQLHNAIAENRGAIFVTPHFGNWELFPAWGKLQGFRGMLVGKRVKDSRLHEMLMEMRLATGVEIVYHDESGRKLVRGLRENAMIGLLPDLDSPRLDGIFLPFFGRQTYCPTSPASLSLMTGAPIVPIFLVFEDGRYRLHAEPAIEPRGGERSDEELRRITQAWSDAFERWIRKHPDHWMWFQRRWTTTPENAPAKIAKRRQ